MVRNVGLGALAVAALLASCGKSGGDGDRRAGGGSGATTGTGAGAPPATAGSSNAGNGTNAGGHVGSGASGGRGSGGAAGVDFGGAGANDGGNAGKPRGAGGSLQSSGGSGDPTAGEAGSLEAGTGNANQGGESSGGTKIPLTLFIMFDRSWSMQECGDGGMTEQTTNSLNCPTQSRWELTSKALTQFVQDPMAAGLGVALRFFPDDQPAQGCDGYPTAGFAGASGMGGVSGAGAALANCDVPACAQPLVPVDFLRADPAPTDTQEAALVAAIQASAPPGPEMPNPNPSTPTYAALAGAEQWAAAYHVAHQGQQTAVVLVTDGEAQGCDTNLTHIATLASSALQNDEVLTYVIGLTGSSEAGLNQLAKSGGTQQAFFVSDGSSVVADFVAALTAIRTIKP